MKGGVGGDEVKERSNLGFPNCPLGDGEAGKEHVLVACGDALWLRRWGQVAHTSDEGTGQKVPRRGPHGNLEPVCICGCHPARTAISENIFYCRPEVINLVFVTTMISIVSYKNFNNKKQAI
jgi:hypothetical protein